MTTAEPSSPCDQLEIVVLAGGEGTRLRSVTGPLPKALVEVAGRPMLDWKLDQLAQAGATRLHLLVGSGQEQIAAHLARRPPPLTVTTHQDGPVLKGTGGALLACRAHLPDRFVITYGDSLLDEPLLPLWRQFLDSGDAAMLAVTRQFDSDHTGNVEIASRRVVAYGKNPSNAALTWLDYGYLAMDKQALHGYTVGERLDLGVIISDLATDGRLGAYEVHSEFWEVGTPESLIRVSQHLSQAGQSDS